VKQRLVTGTFLLTVLLIGLATNANAQTNTPVVHAVLFYSPTCGHCEYVINNTLIPMVQQHGEQLQIIALDVSQPQGQTIFLAVAQKYHLEQVGVPFLVFDDTYLIGSLDIPEKFPALVEAYLAQGGVDWPNIPSLDEVLPQVTSEQATTAPATTVEQTATLQTPSAPVTVTPVLVFPTGPPALGLTHQEDPTWVELFAHDPAGNALAVLVLASMLGAVALAINLFQNGKSSSLKGNWAWIIPALCVIGIGVAAYLAYVETAQVTAVCGPVGDCNTVQQSEYARLFGILPIGVLGLIGYVAIIGAWLVARYAKSWLADLANISLFILTVSGTLFSIYLTFLEPFVIGATCAWCLTSAILMTMLMLLTVRPAKAIFCGSTKARFYPQ
jgi:uncharacterized membrane protein